MLFRSYIYLTYHAKTCWFSHIIAKREVWKSKSNEFENVTLSKKLVCVCITHSLSCYMSNFLSLVKYFVRICNIHSLGIKSLNIILDIYKKNTCFHFLTIHFNCWKFLTWNPSGDMPRRDLSQPQFSSSPLEQARVRACATPADEIAWTNAISLVPRCNNKSVQLYSMNNG